MASRPAENIWRMTDDELAIWTLCAEPGSSDYGAGFAAMRMRTSIRLLDSSKEVLEAVRNLNANAEAMSAYTKGVKDATVQNAEHIRGLKDATVQNAGHIRALTQLGEQMVGESRQASAYAKNLAQSTRNLVWATWGLVVVTAITVIGPSLVHWFKSIRP